MIFTITLNTNLTYHTPQSGVTKYNALYHNKSLTKVTFKGPVETMIMQEGPSIPHELIRWFFYGSSRKNTQLTIGSLPADIAKSADELKKILKDPLWKTKLKGYFTGKQYKQLNGGMYANLLRIKTKFNTYLIKSSKLYTLRHSAYKDIIYPMTGEFVPKVRIGLGNEAVLAYYLTQKGFKNAAKFYYYNEPLACMITEYIHSPTAYTRKKVDTSKFVDSANRYISQSPINKELIEQHKVRFVDSAGSPNYGVSQDKIPKIIDFVYWTDVVDKEHLNKFNSIKENVAIIKNQLVKYDENLRKYPLP